MQQEQMLGFLRAHGPSMPSQVAKYIHTEILLASAMLSEAVAQGKVKISSLKIGGTPLYYLSGQESQLERFAAGNLNPKDLAVLHKLKQQHALREAQMDLLEKVSIRSLKDFAVPLQVTLQGKGELFWKWHLSTQQEVHEAISALLSPPEIAPMGPVVSSAAGQQKEQQAEEQGAATPQEPVRTSLTLTPAASIEQEPARMHLPPVPAPPETEEEKRSPQKLKERSRSGRRHEEFFPQVEEACKKLKISIEQKETIRRNAELELILKVPSAVGMMTYFCKAKNKARCDEKDLSAAYMQAQIKKLPLLLLYTGELTKKAQEMLDSGALENVVVKKVG